MPKCMMHMGQNELDFLEMGIFFFSLHYEHEPVGNITATFTLDPKKCPPCICGNRWCRNLPRVSCCCCRCCCYWLNVCLAARTCTRDAKTYILGHTIYALSIPIDIYKRKLTFMYMGKYS